MTYPINSSTPSYQNLTLSNVSASAKIDSTGNNLVAATLDTSSNDSFVQNVIQSLGNLGLNTSDVSTNESLQVFVQDLSKALMQGDPQSLPINAAADVPVAPNTMPASETKFSGGTNFQYSVDLSQADLGDNFANVASNIKTALDNIGQFISSKVIFDLKVVTVSINSGTLAQANSALVTTTTPNPNNPLSPIKSTDTSFISDSIRGVDSSPNEPDSTLFINLANMDKMSFSGTPTPDKYDLTTILTHEILHGLAFTGTFTVNAPRPTAYDSLITPQPPAPQNAPAFFIGRHAQTVNGGTPIPLSPESSGPGSAYYHIAVPSDLMSESINKGEVKSISALDVAMLEDMGVTVTGVLAPPSKVQTAYSNPMANLQNLMNSLDNGTEQNNALQADFSTLVTSLGGSPASGNLQNFLTQLSSNAVNGNSLQNDSGSIFSATA
ncbi:MAG: hypothetical protein WCL34_05980 [Methylococcaceae bacterium]